MMISKKAGLIAGAMLAGAMFYAAPASAQATRTWISGVGDDVNPCSRTAPCKTFAGAISKTAAGGEINCYDPGGFGTVTITKAMSIICDNNPETGVLPSGTPGFTVNAGDTDIVTISGIDLLGPTTFPGTYGVRIVNAGGVNLRNMTIKGNSQQAIDLETGTGKTTFLNVDNVIIIGNGTVGDTTTGAIKITPGNSSTANVTLNNVRVAGNANVGLRLDTTGFTGNAINATVVGSQFTNDTVGILFKGLAGTGTINAVVVGSVMTGNATSGVTGNGPGVTSRFSGNTISGNGFGVTTASTGVTAANSAQVLSMSNNLLQGNVNMSGTVTNGAFSGTFLPN